ncbi:sulfite exporter TauE/SafE family protein [Pararhodonellum marinum]|uniref:sulfite exporter TauE/SafE family protein n=1 Tax=Pararhodonellum marinum TaxID=2755358 RepID=UPI00188FA71E|nr:sulfite exporter TauE/SafE family protein [Pararhodonellum marinum]
MLWTAFLLGLLGSFHCLGMCGPIALAISAKEKSQYYSRKLAYNFGRTVTYTFLGAIIGMLGFSLSLVGIQQWVSIGMGVLILIMAFNYKKAEALLAKAGWFGIIFKLKNALGSRLNPKQSGSYFIIGLLNGFLPCGMVYMALVASLALQNPLQGAFYMFFFGLGTIPLLLGLMVSGKMFSLRVRQKLLKGMPYLAMFVGILFIARGLGLGISMFSPSFTMAQGRTNGTIEMTMCSGD